MTSEEALQRQKEFQKRRKKALHIGLKKLQRQDEKRQVAEEEEIQRRPYHSYEATEITKRKGRDDDPYDIESLFIT